MGIDHSNAPIAQFFDDLRAQSWMTPAQVDWTRFLFHFTDITNLPTILEAGALKSRRALESQRRSFASTANQEILDHTPDAVKRCVRLYFRPRVPMLHRVEGVRPTATLDGAPHCPIPVYLLFDANSVLGLPGVKVSQGNLSSTVFNPRLTTPITGLRSLPFEEVYHDRGLTQEDKQRIVFHRQAETIVPDSLDLKHLRGILVRSSAERATLQSLITRVSKSLLQQFGPMIQVNRREQLFFREWLYVEDVWYDEKSLGIQLNADARARGPFAMKLRVSDATGNSGALWTEKWHDIILTRDVHRIRLPIDLQTEMIEVVMHLDHHLVYDNILSVGRMVSIRN